MSLEASYALTIDGTDAPLRVRSFLSEERVFAPYRVDVELEVADRTPLVAEALLGQAARFTLRDPLEPRVFRAVVDAIEARGRGYRVTLVPRLALLADAVDHRVRVGEDPIALAEEVLRAHHLDVERRLSRSAEPRAQCVQAFETDLDFVCRLLAEEGVLFHLEQDEGRDVVVLSDHTGAYPPVPGGDALALAEGEQAGLVGPEAIFAVESTRATVTDRVVLRDVDLSHPLADPSVESGSGPLEFYEHAAGYIRPDKGQELAAIRLEEARARAFVLRGKSNCRRLFPGATFQLTGDAAGALGRRWLVVEVSQRGIDFDAEPGNPEGRRHEAEFVAVPAASAYRAARCARPTLGGMQTGVVTGAADGEIHPDALGRIKVHLRWDRERAMDDQSSAWVRPVQPPTTGGFFLPRVGWEVLLGFEGPSADEPYALGRLYNAEGVPPEGLPGKKVRSAFGSRTTPGGGGANVLTFDDAAGAEGMYLDASRDYTERTENDKVSTVTADDVQAVGSTRTETVGIAKTVQVQGAETYTIAADRSLSIEGNHVISAATESVQVGGMRLFLIGGDHETQAATLSRMVGAAKAEVAIQGIDRHVTGFSTVAVGGSWQEIGGLSAATGVLGATSLVVGGLMSIGAREVSLKARSLKETYGAQQVKAGARHVESFGGAAKYKVGGSLRAKASSISFVAKSKITLHASGVKIVIEQGKITVKGALKSSMESVVTGDLTNG
ncbi:type VI secretion system Vgr family protein [Chondromyces crocatus]|uniref:Uncharacterized protein n=1 Tax=Chondromyces crocatus TaxID=52 RepID=A0A0K1EJI3_CHOCO|nr:type VI secretion system tip protein TssI/VgrG [Chondromyces crocatus]AKT40743.1 uncharacterized protein CMC5_048990 [Chondromyces crocatus]